MGNKNLILIMPLTVIWISGCGPPYDFREHVQLRTASDAFEGYTMTYIHGSGTLDRIDGLIDHAYLIPRKFVYENGTVTFNLQYQKSIHPEGNALYLKELIFLIDGQRHRLRFTGSKRSHSDVGGDEWGFVDVTEEILENIAYASDVSLRVVGNDGSIEYHFNERYHYCFKRFYEECVLSSESSTGKQKDSDTRKIIGYRAKRDTKTGEYKTYPVYEDEKK